MIDARGQLCPMPVIMVQKAAKENPAEIQVCWLRHCASLCGHHRKEGAALLGGHPPHAEDLPVHSSGC